MRDAEFTATKVRQRTFSGNGVQGPHSVYRNALAAFLRVYRNAVAAVLTVSTGTP
jgi:hypothetical protein